MSDEVVGSLDRARSWSEQRTSLIRVVSQNSDNLGGAALDEEERAAKKRRSSGQYNYFAM